MKWKDNIKNYRFSGHIRLNNFHHSVNLVGGITFHTGIYNAWLHNCEVGKNALIHNVRSYIANYNIGEGSLYIMSQQLLLTAKVHLATE